MLRGRLSALEPRQQEVAGLIGESKSNWEIATGLVIAESTVERHVANIMAKLGVHARPQIAAWVTETWPRCSTDGVKAKA